MLAFAYSLFLSSFCLSALAVPTYNINNNNNDDVIPLEKRVVVVVTADVLQVVTVQASTATAKSSSSSAGPTTTSVAATTTTLSCPAASGKVYSAANGETFTVQCYVDHSGGDSGYVGAATLDACITTCSTTAGCVAVSWVPGSPGTCWLKTTLMSAVSNSGVWGAVLNIASAAKTTSPTTTATSTVAISSSSSVVLTTTGAKTTSPTTMATSIIPISSSIKVSSTTSAKATSSGFPFTQIVAFGDNLSDNGNGSYAHGVSGSPATIYGYGTWTDGPVAVSYLSTMLSAPLTTDYAFGHANGGSLFGATIDNTYTNSTANAPDAFAQVANYTSSGKLGSIATTLHFLWIGANDINLYHINCDSTTNPGFASDMSTRMVKLVQNLVNAGAMHIMVPALYPKHISPSAQFYAGTATEVTNLGHAIAQANSAISSALASSFPAGTGKPKVVFYDAYSYMMNMWNNAASFGFTHVGGEFCDGYSQADWNLCVTDNEGYMFYWMQYLDMTTYVHKLLAADMASAIKTAYASS